MAEVLLPQDAIPSSRVALFVLPKDGSTPIPLALVEDFAVSKVVASENFTTIGVPVVPDNVSNIEQGRVRWGRVHQQDPTIQAAISPQIAQWNRFKPFNLLAVDPESGDPVAMAVGVRPETMDYQVRGGAALRSNYTAICRYVLTGPEVKKSAS